MTYSMTIILKTTGAGMSMDLPGSEVDRLLTALDLNCNQRLYLRPSDQERRHFMMVDVLEIQRVRVVPCTRPSLSSTEYELPG